MRKRFGIGVIVAVLLVGLAPPGFSGPDRNDQVVAAGVGAGVGEAIERTFQRGLQLLGRFLGRARLNPAEVEAAAVRLKRMIPTVIQTPWGEQRQLSAGQWWELVDVACKAKDVHEFLRQDTIDEQLRMLEAELPGAVGARASVRELADDMAQAQSIEDKVRTAAIAGVCATADKTAG